MSAAAGTPKPARKKKIRIHDLIAANRLQAVMDFWENNHVDHPRCLETRDEVYRCPIHVCCVSGRLEILKFLISVGVNIEAVSKFGYRPLHLAVLYRKMPLVEVLVNAGADVNARDNNGATPLITACACVTGLEIVLFLVRKGADVNAKDNDGQGVVHHAAVSGKFVELARYFVEECKVDPLRPDNAGETPFLLATAWGRKDVLKYFIECTAKQMAVEEGNIDELEKEIAGMEAELKKIEEESLKDEAEEQARLARIYEEEAHRQNALLAKQREDAAGAAPPAAKGAPAPAAAKGPPAPAAAAAPAPVAPAK